MGRRIYLCEIKWSDVIISPLRSIGKNISMWLMPCVAGMEPWQCLDVPKHPSASWKDDFVPIVENNDDSKDIGY